MSRLLLHDDGLELADGTTLPVGVSRLQRELAGDPPEPAALTNAIGLVADYLDDVVRERPELVVAPLELAGPLVLTLAAVDLGATVSGPYRLGRDAAEDVFRTVATEPRAARRMNPGLPAAHVDTVVAACCAVVAVMRTLHLDEVTVVGG